MIFKKIILLSLIIFFSTVDGGSEKTKTTENNSVIHDISSKENDSNKISDADKDEIISSMGNCTASCCSNPSINKKEKLSTKNKNKQKGRRFGWFSRNK